MKNGRNNGKMKYLFFDRNANTTFRESHLFVHLANWYHHPRTPIRSLGLIPHLSLPFSLENEMKRNKLETKTKNQQKLQNFPEIFLEESLIVLKKLRKRGKFGAKRQKKKICGLCQAAGSSPLVVSVSTYPQDQADQAEPNSFEKNMHLVCDECYNYGDVISAIYGSNGFVNKSYTSIVISCVFECVCVCCLDRL